MISDAEAIRLIREALGVPDATRPQLVAAVTALRDAIEPTGELVRRTGQRSAREAVEFTALVERDLAEIRGVLRAPDQDWPDVIANLRLLLDDQPLTAAARRALALRSYVRQLSEALLAAGLPATSERPMVVAAWVMARAADRVDGDGDHAYDLGYRHALEAVATVIKAPCRHLTLTELSDRVLGALRRLGGSDA